MRLPWHILTLRCVWREKDTVNHWKKKKRGRVRVSYPTQNYERGCVCTVGVCVCLPATWMQTFNKAVFNATEYNIPELPSMKGSWFSEAENTHRYLSLKITSDSGFNSNCRLLLRRSDTWQNSLLVTKCFCQWAAQGHCCFVLHAVNVEFQVGVTEASTEKKCGAEADLQICNLPVCVQTDRLMIILFLGCFFKYFQPSSQSSTFYNVSLHLHAGPVSSFSLLHPAAGFSWISWTDWTENERPQLFSWGFSCWVSADLLARSRPHLLSDRVLPPD